MKKKGINGRKVLNDRNSKFRPWEPMVPFAVPSEAAELGVVAAWQNHLVTVFIKITSSPNMADPAGEPQEIVHIMANWVKGLRGSADQWYRWRMSLKDDIGLKEADAVEILPARWREQDVRQDMVWALPVGATLPMGLFPADIEQALAAQFGGRDNLVTKEELELYVVRHQDGVTEVFASEDDCKAAYGDKPVPEGAKASVEMMGSVPTDDDMVAWTDAAKIKAANVVAKGRRAVEEAEQGDGSSSRELFGEKWTVEDDLWPGLEENGPDGLEDKLAMATVMRDVMDQRAEERVAKLRAVTEEVTGRGQRAIDAAKAAADKPKIIIP